MSHNACAAWPLYSGTMDVPDQPSFAVRIRLLTVLAGLFALLFLTALQAQPVRHYRWVDAQGHTHLSDEVPASAVHLGYDVLNKYGRVLRHVEGAKSEAELAAEARQAEQAERRHKQARQDRYLLATYRTEAALIESQSRQTTMTERRIKTTRVNMKSQLKNLGELLEQAGERQQQGKPVPKYLQDRIDKQRQIIRKQASWISAEQQKLEQARAENARVLEHYRALKEPDSDRDDNRNDRLSTASTGSTAKRP